MYDDMIEFVGKYINTTGNNASQLSFAYPFRNRFEHTLRVCKWAKRINEIEKGDEEVVIIASLFHDVGKGSCGNIDHGIVGANICRGYLEGVKFEEFKIKKIENAILNHTQIINPRAKLSLEDKILIDADLLDEVGAMTILWDALATGMEDKPSYNKVYYRILDNLNSVTNCKAHFKTETGKKFYDERVSILLNYIDNLKYELGI